MIEVAAFQTKHSIDQLNISTTYVTVLQKYTKTKVGCWLLKGDWGKKNKFQLRRVYILFLSRVIVHVLSANLKLLQILQPTISCSNPSCIIVHFLRVNLKPSNESHQYVRIILCQNPKLDQNGQFFTVQNQCESTLC